MRARTSPCFNLLTQTQLGDQGTITLDVLLGQIVQQTAALTDHHLHTAAAVEVVGMHLQVSGQLVDALGQDSDLHFGEPVSVSWVRLASMMEVFWSFSIIVVFPPFLNYARILSRGREWMLRAAKARGSAT